MHRPLILLLAALSTASTLSAPITCIDIPQEYCECTSLMQGQTTRFEITCPSEETPSLKIFYTPEESLHIDCQSHNASEYLKNLTIPHGLAVSSYKLSYCMLDEDSLGYFGLRGVEHLTIIGNESFQSYSLQRGFFDEFKGLKSLTITQAELKVLPDGVFPDGLENLDLGHNRLEIIDGQLANLKRLKRLYLNGNKIHTVTAKAFKGMRDLEILHLFRNKITELFPETFNDLRNLDSVDLMSNSLREFNTSVLRGLERVKIINLDANYIGRVIGRIGDYTTSLEKLRMSKNHNLTELPKAFLSNLPNLKEVVFSTCNLRRLPDDLLNNTRNVEKLELQDNDLQSLPDGLFAGSEQLTFLNVARNNISDLKSFISLGRLNHLDLRNNSFTQLETGYLNVLPNLQTLHLDWNALEVIEVNMLPVEVVTLTLSHNKLTYEGVMKPILAFSLPQLKKLDLSYNQFSEVFVEFSYPHLEEINFAYNYITEINHSMMQSPLDHRLKLDFRNNPIKIVNLHGIEVMVSHANSLNSSVRLSGSSLICDCSAYNFLRFLQGAMPQKVYERISIEIDSLKCASPAEYAGEDVRNLTYKEVMCDLEDCPDDCGCKKRPYDDAFLMDCAGKGLEYVPKLDVARDYTRIEVDLKGNYIKEFTVNETSYERVNVLDLSDNLLTEFTWVSNITEVLKLNGNKLQRLKNEVIHNFTGKVLLDHNPWICDCQSLRLFEYVKGSVLPNKENVICANKNKSMYHLSERAICPMHNTATIVIIVTVALIITILSIIFGLYYKFNREIKVWLYAHNLLLWFVTEEDLDKDKEYDAFICFSHVDELIVMELVSQLESGPKPFKLCIHMRNFIPGEFIATQVINSVKSSRRTVVLVSPSFLKSVWGKLEFRTAHTEAMTEGRARVIVILLDNVNIESELDEELKAYLKTNTYIKWGDPWFWEKLRYALPHRSKIKGDNRANKLHSISINLDKMDFINANLTPSVGNKPPAHPLLIKGRTMDVGNETPPAEAGNLEGKIAVPAV